MAWQGGSPARHRSPSAATSEAARHPVPPESEESRPGETEDLQEQFRLFQKFMEKRSSRRPGGKRDDSEDEGDNGRGDRGSSGPPPEWSGDTPFEDYLIRARLWVATTKTRPRARGPGLLRSLKGGPFETFKYLAKDASWLESDKNAEDLLALMDRPEHYGEDREEHLLAALSRITFHIKRNKSESWQEFFARWENALRRVKEHRVELPQVYLGFLLIHGLRLSEADIKAMLNYNRGVATSTTIREWLRKNESKMTLEQLGNDQGSSKKTAAVYHVEASEDILENEDDEDDEQQEIYALEKGLSDLQANTAHQEQDEGILSEGEAAEVLSTILAKKKQTYTQTMKAKKHQELARGYSKPPSAAGHPRRRDDRPARYKVSGDLTIDEVKKKTRCSRCLQVGHWWKECPNPPAPGRAAAGGHGKTAEKETHFLEEEVYFCGMLDEIRESPLLENDLEEKPPLNDNTESLLPEDDMEKMIDDLKDIKEPPPTQPVASLIGESCESVNIPDEKQAAAADSPESPAFGRSEFSERATARAFDIFEGGNGQKNLEHFREADGANRIAGEEYMSVNSLFLFENWLCETARVKTPVPDTACATVDTGCQRLAVGLKTLHDMLPHIPEPLNIRTLYHQYRFRSVHGTSTTQRIGILPSSLGDRGAYLKPAIFEDDHGQHAPMLISLPFLLQSEATLQLIPGRGLYLHMRRANKKVQCHLGSTGALRVPIFDFSREMIGRLYEQRECHGSAEEFEVLSTASLAQASDSSVGLEPCTPTPRGPGTTIPSTPTERGPCY